MMTVLSAVEGIDPGVGARCCVAACPRTRVMADIEVMGARWCCSQRRAGHSALPLDGVARGAVVGILHRR
jgi:hypothetical protein